MVKFNLFSNLLFIFYLLKTKLTSSLNFPVKTKYIKSTNLKVIGPVKSKFEFLNPTKDIIFLSGGANFIPNELYSNFLNNLASSNFKVYLSDYTNEDNFDNLLKSIDSNNIIIVLHSSSTKLAVDLSNKYNQIKKIVFLDPVDNRFTISDICDNIMNKPNKMFVDIDDAIIINAEKSYTGSWNPPTIPFIPILSLNKDNLILKNNKSIETISFKDFGHTDLLDKPWGDIMHKTRISVGSLDRKYTDINNYHQNIVDVISKFCN